MNILAIDTSNHVLGVAIVKDGLTLGECVLHGNKDHSARLMPAIELMMKQTKMKPTDLNRIVVGVGPGSYTGVRISVTTAKTMAWSLGIDVVGVSSLELLAWQGKLFSGYLIPFFDARRGQVYTTMYENNNTSFKQVMKIVNPIFSDWLKEVPKDKKVLFLSPDIELHRNTILTLFNDQAVIPDGVLHYARPSILAHIGAEKTPINHHEIVPDYARQTEAETNWLLNQLE